MNTRNELTELWNKNINPRGTITYPKLLLFSSTKQGLHGNAVPAELVGKYSLLSTIEYN